jgi:hypothetical protein
MRSLLLSIVYSFCSDSIAAHITAIKALQDELNDQSCFMLSLASLIELESSFDDDLLDLYLYYCVVGLGMASPRLQSAALAMLQSCAVQQPSLVVAKLPLVTTLCKSRWWEVEAQLVVLACTLLETLEGEDAQPALSLVESLVTPVTLKRADLLRVVACKLAPCLVTHQAVLQPLYSSVLLALSAPMLKELLNKNCTPMLSVPLTSVVAPLGLTSPPLQWDAKIVADGIIADALTSQHLEVLLACAPGLDGISAGQLLDRCATAVFNCLGEPALCDTAVEVLRSVLCLAPVTSVCTSLPAFVKSLLLLFPNGDESCRIKVAALVGQIAEMQSGAVKADLVAALQAAPDLLQVPELSQIVS